MLTKRHADLLAFIRAYQTQHEGVSPSFTEMQEGIGLGSKSGICRLLNAMEERGVIERLHNRCRAIRIIAQTPGDRPPIAPGALPSEVAAIIVLRARLEANQLREGGERFTFDRLEQIIVEILSK